MHLIQLFLPLADNDGQRFERERYDEVERTLVERFGGFTAYPRAPASGLWVSPSDGVTKDDMIVYEALVEVVDRAWWKDYRARLEERFRQDVILVRATPVEVL